MLAPPPGEWFELDEWEGYQTIQQRSTYDFSLKCIVYDSQDNTAYDIHYVTVGGELNKPLSDENQSLPIDFRVSQNYPNPFPQNGSTFGNNPITTIKYQLPEDAHVFLAVYDIQGRELEKLVEADQPSGYKSVTWDASNVVSGVYFYRIQVTNKGKVALNKIGKMAVVK